MQSLVNDGRQASKGYWSIPLKDVLWKKHYQAIGDQYRRETVMK